MTIVLRWIKAAICMVHVNSARQVLTIKQVAEFLQVSTDKVYRLATSGELQGRKIGRIWRLPKNAVQRNAC